MSVAKPGVCNCSPRDLSTVTYLCCFRRHYLDRTYTNDELKFIVSTMQGRMSRRDVLKRGAAFGFSAALMSALLAACGTPAEDDDSGSSTDTGSTGTGSTDSSDGGSDDATAPADS